MLIFSLYKNIKVKTNSFIIREIYFCLLFDKIFY